MSMDQPRRPTRAPGGPAGRSPRGSSPAIAVVVALLAAVLGFVILKSLDDDSSVTTSGGDPETTTPATDDTGVVDSAATTVTTLPAVDRAAWNVLVANASGVKGSAGSLTDQLTSLGYSKMLPATNATDPTKVDATVVYYVIGAEQIGADVAATLGKTPAQPMPATLPVAMTDFVGGHVLIMLGTDLAGVPIPGATVTATTVAPAAGASPNTSAG